MFDVRQLPKAELHCHSDGLLDPAMLSDLLGAGHELNITADGLQQRFPIDSTTKWIEEYVPYVSPHLEPITHWHPLLIEHHVQRLKYQRVVYAELFVSGLLFAFTDIGAVVDFFHELRHRVDEVAAPDLCVEFVICVGRGPKGKLERQLPRIEALHKAGVTCGVALAGAEAEYPVQPLKDVFNLFRDLGLGIEIHAGEFAGPESVWDAVKHGSPDRIGHGVSAFEDEALVQLLVDEQIHLEFCPTSNLRLGVVQELERHPLSRARELGLSFSINTDDPGPFDCSLSSEFELVQKTFGFCEDDFGHVLRSTLDARFGALPEPERHNSPNGAT